MKNIRVGRYKWRVGEGVERDGKENSYLFRQKREKAKKRKKKKKEIGKKEKEVTR